MKKNRLIGCLLSFLLVTATGCGLLPKGNDAKSEKKSTTGKASTDKKSDFAVTANAASAKFTKVFVGKIGTYDVTMTISRENAQLDGSYAYDKNFPVLRGVLNSLSVAGEVAADGSFTLKETEFNALKGDGAEKQTGKFTGKLTQETNGANAQLKLAGTWTKPNGEKPTPFTLLEEVFDLGPQVTILSKEIKETNKVNRFSFSAVFPALSGATDPGAAAINKNVENWVKAEQKTWLENFKPDPEEKSETSEDNAESATSEVEITYEVSFANAGIVSFVMNTYASAAQAAHPNTAVQTLNFDRKTGRQLELKDLFRADAPYLETLARISNDLSRKTPEYSLSEFEPNPDNFKNWSVSRHGFWVYTEVPHVIGDTAAMYIPYGELKAVLNPSGPLASL
ncbi:MAG: DUF4163 domain-containing protein [Blastocatellia bacterium]|nr:DUF4163 domain-containing protein [Blastocatellia bacterium]